MKTELMKRAVRLFPRTEFNNVAAVRHARRKWLQSVILLRCAPGGSKWILDKPVLRG